MQSLTYSRRNREKPEILLSHFDSNYEKQLLSITIILTNLNTAQIMYTKYSESVLVCEYGADVLSFD